eukprot:s1947_g2.t1
MIGNGATLLIDRILGCEQFSLKRSNKNEAKCHLATHLEATNGLDLPWPSRLERRSIGFDLSGENGFEAMETTAEMVEERLREMQDRGVLKPDELDEHAEAQLRASDPDIALEALSQWETSSFKRRNPSACMVSLLKKLNEQGLDLGPSGAVEPDVAAQQQAEDLMSEMSDKIDASATRSLRSLDPTEALSILHELRHADGIRNHSAFIMSAVKRCNNQGRSSGSRRRDPPRLQQGPYAEEDDGYGYGGFGYDVDNVYGGDDYESHHSDRRNGNSYQDRSRDNRVYGSYDYGSDDGDRYGRYDGGRSGYDRNDRGYEDQSYYEERGSGRRSYIEE